MQALSRSAAEGKQPRSRLRLDQRHRRRSLQVGVGGTKGQRGLLSIDGMNTTSAGLSRLDRCLMISCPKRRLPALTGPPASLLMPALIAAGMPTSPLKFMDVLPDRHADDPYWDCSASAWMVVAHIFPAIMLAAAWRRGRRADDGPTSMAPSWARRKEAGHGAGCRQWRRLKAARGDVVEHGRRSPVRLR